MLHKSHKFIYHFLILFLAVLLVMFGMHYGLVKYNNHLSQVKPGIVFDMGKLFRINLFVIDLCVLVIVEAMLILLFHKYTVPSVVVATAAMVIFLSVRDLASIRILITRVFSPFIANKYAFLEISDVIVLIILNMLILSFLITVLLKEADEARFPAWKKPNVMPDRHKVAGDDRRDMGS